jgi:hypothetical protein
MEMFLIILFSSFAALAVSCVMFAGLAPKKDKPAEARTEPTTTAAPARFFVNDAVRTPIQSRIPMEVLLSQLERHVRLEQAAAESFLSGPTVESLHSRTTSPFAN